MKKIILLTIVLFLTIAALYLPKTSAVTPTGTWEKKTTGISSVADITGLAVSAQNWNTLYVVTGSSGVYKSTDGGATWTAKNSGLTTLTINYDHLFENLLAIDATNDNTLYAAFGGSIFRTTNGGDSWSEMSTGTTLDCTPNAGSQTSIIGILIDHTNPNHLWAGTTVSGCNGGVFEIENVSQNQTWVNIAGNLVSGSNMGNDSWELIQHPSQVNTLFSTAVHGKVRKSTDGGATWVDIPPPDIGDSTGLLRVNASGTLFLTVNGHLYQSTNQGSSWTTIADLPATTDLQIAPSDQNTLYAVTSEGLYKSTDGGTSWQTRGFADNGLNSLRIHPTDENRLYLGSFAQGLFTSLDGGTTIQAVSQNLPQEIRASYINYHPTQTNTLYASISNQGIYQSTDNGNTWQLHATNPQVGNAFTFTIDPGNPNIWYTHNEAIQKSTDGGLTWTAVLSPPNTYFRAVAIAPGNSNVLYASSFTENKIYKSENVGASWSVVAEGMNTDVFAIHPENSQLVYAANLDGLWKSINGGSTWENLYLGREDIFGTGLAGIRFETVSVNPENGNEVFAANRTFEGFLSEDGGITWTSIITSSHASYIGKATFSKHHPNLIYTSDSVSIYQIEKQGSTYQVTELPKANIPDSEYLKSKFVGVIEHPTDPNQLWVNTNNLYQYDLPLGDVDGDGDVDTLDFAELIQNFNTSYAPADFNESGLVDLFDFNTLVENFGQ